MVIATQVEADAYTSRDGEARASLNITADEVRFLQGGDPNMSGSGGDVNAAQGEYGNDDDFSPPDDMNDIPF